MPKKRKTPTKKSIYYIDIERDEKRNFVFSDVLEGKISKKLFDKYFPNENRVITLNQLPVDSKMTAISPKKECAEAFHIGLMISDKLSNVWDEMYNNYIENKLYNNI